MCMQNTGVIETLNSRKITKKTEARIWEWLDDCYNELPPKVTLDQVINEIMDMVANNKTYPGQKK